MATDYTIPKDEYRALVDERDKLLDGFHAMQQLYEDELKHALSENAKLRKLLQASLRDFRRIYNCDEQDGWKMVDAIDRMVIGMRELGLDAGCTEQELRIKVL